MREITLDDWIKEGHGFSADSYRNKNDDTLLLKLFFTSDGEAHAMQEYKRAVAVMKLGIPTPKTYEVVKVGDCTGIIYERILDKKSFGVLCTENPEKIPEYARVFARYSKLLHTTKCDTDFFPRRKDRLYEILDIAKDKVDLEIRDYLYKLIESSKDCDTCLHNDLQTGNMVMGWCKGWEGREKNPDEDYKAYFIDLGSFGYGDPIFDVATLYMCARVYQNERQNIDLLHMEPEIIEQFWESYIPEYIGTDDPEEIKAFEAKVRPYSMFFIVSIINAADGNQTVVQVGQKHLKRLFEESQN